MKSRNLLVFLITGVLAGIVLHLLAATESVIQTSADILALHASLLAGDSLIPTIGPLWRTIILAAVFAFSLTCLIDRLLVPHARPSCIASSATACGIVAVAVFVIDIKLGWRLAHKLGGAIDIEHFWAIQLWNVVFVALISVAIGWLIGRIISLLYEEKYNAEHRCSCAPPVSSSNNDIPW